MEFVKVLKFSLQHRKFEASLQFVIFYHLFDLVV